MCVRMYACVHHTYMCNCIRLSLRLFSWAFHVFMSVIQEKDSQIAQLKAEVQKLTKVPSETGFGGILRHVHSSLQSV